MSLGAEGGLVLLVWGLYLADSFLLLRPDEAVLAPAGKRWAAHFGTRSWTLAGRQPMLAPPLLPHRPMFRLRWRPEGTTAPPAAPLAVPAGLRRLAPYTWLAALDLLVALPLALRAGYGGAAVIAVAAVAYANILAAAATLAWRGRAWGLPAVHPGWLALELCACPPHSINLIRRIAARMPVDEDLLAAAGRLLPPEAMPEVHRQCLARVDDLIELADEGSAEMAALQRARERFAQEASR